MRTRVVFAVAVAMAAALTGPGPAAASSPVRWQVSVGREAVLTARGGARLPFSTNSNPSPALHPTQLFPEPARADQTTVVLRGEIRVYLAVTGFAAAGEGAAGTETAAYDLALPELTLERATVGGEVRWRIPEAEYAGLLKRLGESKVKAAERK